MEKKKDKFLWETMSAIQVKISEIEDVQGKLENIIEDLIDFREGIFHYLTVSSKDDK